MFVVLKDKERVLKSIRNTNQRDFAFVPTIRRDGRSLLPGMEHQNATNMEKIVSLAKRRGFIFPGSEIYGGPAGTRDYGPMGGGLKRDVKEVLWGGMGRGR